MTPRTMSVACVDPCGKATAVVCTYAANVEVEEQDALTRPTYTSRKATAVVGNSAAKNIHWEARRPDQTDFVLSHSHASGRQLWR